MSLYHYFMQCPLVPATQRILSYCLIINALVKTAFVNRVFMLQLLNHISQKPCPTILARSLLTLKTERSKAQNRSERAVSVL